jgi:hypothetical protein
MFTGHSIFKRDDILIGSLVLDDAHTCLNKARDATTVKIPANHELYGKIIRLFESDLSIKQKVLTKD